MKGSFAWLFFSLYILVSSLSVSFLFLPGIGRIRGSGSAGVGILLICLAVIACYAATAYFLKAAAPWFFTGGPRSDIF